MIDDKGYLIKANLYDGLDCDDDIIFYQNDTRQSKIVAEFTGKKRAAIDVADCTVVCVIQKSDKEIVTAYMENDFNVANRAEYVLSQNALASTGKGIITIFVYGSDNERQTFGSIKFKVLKDVNSGSVESTTEYPVLTKLISDTKVVVNDAENAKNEILGVSADIANSEKQRVSAETKREENESSRINEFAGIKKEYESLKGIMIDENNAVNLQNQINEANSQLDNNTNKVNETISSYDSNLIEVKQRLFNHNFKNRQYIFVGDSLRDSNGRHVFKKMAYKLATNGISPCLIAKSGLKAEHWSKTNITQDLKQFPTTDDVIKAIKGDGSECVVDICLCTNDLTKTETEVVAYLKRGINDILIAKPNTKFIITSPNRYNDTDAINNKALNICKTVVTDLKNVAFSDVMTNVFRTRAETIPYLLDSQHPNPLGQDKIGEYKIKQLFDGSDTLTYDIEFEELIFNNTDGSKTVIRYAINYDFIEGDTLYIQKDYENKWLFVVNTNGNIITLTELITENGFSVLKSRYNTDRCVYGLLEIENIEGLINHPSSSILKIETNTKAIVSKIQYPINITPNRIYNTLKNIKFYDINGTFDSNDVKYSLLGGVSFKVGFYRTAGDKPTDVYLKRDSENGFSLVDGTNSAISNGEYIDKDGVYNVRPITWGTIRVNGKMKIKNLAKLKEALSIGEKIKVVNAEQYSPIVEKSIIELLDY